MTLETPQTSPDDVVRLTAGDWSATLAPGLGGTILSLEKAGRAIFRPSPEDASDILDTACFPLVPYANRIADGRFTFGGREIMLPVLPRFAPHALHGDGWLRAWSVEQGGDGSVTLGLKGGGDHWPWPWTATQTITLSEQGLRIDLSMTNDATEPAPAGLGLHPYFHRSADMALRLASSGVWLTDAREIPSRLAPPGDIADWTSGLTVSQAPFVDHAYAGWDGRAVLCDASGDIVMTASDTCRWTQVYAPPGEHFVCVEPVTHRPDAVHAPVDEDPGLVVLRPGEALSIWMTVGTHR